MGIRWEVGDAVAEGAIRALPEGMGVIAVR